MMPLDIVRYRLESQQIGHTDLKTPEEIVRWLGAVQAQEYAGGLWGIGLRLPGLTETDIEQALNQKRIIRTWPMRGTLHFVPARDARWMLELLAPRIISKFRGRYQELRLHDADFKKGRELFTEALSGGRSMTRDELFTVLVHGGISPAGQRGYHILANLGLNAVVCFGPRKGKQQTFVLFDEWVRKSIILQRPEALAELARRYFASHGPATLQDFAWWSGLTATDARAGIESIAEELARHEIGGRAYWMARDAEAGPATAPQAQLLPHFDEYIVAYRDRSALLEPAHQNRITTLLLTSWYIIIGRVAGTWKRVIEKEGVVVTTREFRSLDREEISALSAAADRYGAFLGKPAVHRHEEYAP